MPVRVDPSPKRIRVAVIGGGAVTESFHLPVLRGHDGIELTALVEPDAKRGSRLAAAYQIPKVLPSADTIDSRLADAAVIATPPFLHASGAIDLMTRGLHVLVEKPMALSMADGQDMVSLARQKGLALSVGLFRRLLPAVRLFRAALDSKQIGELCSIDAEVGSAYTWQLTSLAGMNREQAGGGILIDMGSHVLDLLAYICGGVLTLVSYTDNASGGIETDCVVEMSMRTNGGVMPVRMELSRTRTLRNTIRAEGTSGAVEWAFGERSRLRVFPPAPFFDTVAGASRDCVLEARWLDDVEQLGYQGFRDQLDDWLEAIRQGGTSQLSGASTLPTVDLIERSYASRVPLDEPWFTEGLAVTPPAGRRLERSKRVLITGASGFIGCRLSEVLHFGSDWRVRALIRSAGRAVRLARMPVEFAVGDLLSLSDLTQALEGCDAVVHAAIGTSWRRSERVTTNTRGTKNLVEAALRAGVKRFVHLSTLAVYGDQVTGLITENTSVSPKKGWDYAESKYAAEQVVLEAAARGLPAVILRIGVVYGPHNMTIVVRPLQHLVQNRLFLVDCRDVPSNTMYVDNLCHGIRLALEGDQNLTGQIVLMSDDDGYTWGDYFGYFANQIGASLRDLPKDSNDSPALSQRHVLHRWVASTRDLLTSTEAKAMAKRVYQSDPWGTPARWMIDTFPEAARRVKALVRPDSPLVYEPRQALSAESDRFLVDPISARVSTEKAHRLLGFSAVVPRQRAMELTLAWARWARIVPNPMLVPTR